MKIFHDFLLLEIMALRKFCISKFPCAHLTWKTNLNFTVSTKVSNRLQSDSAPPSRSIPKDRPQVRTVFEQLPVYPDEMALHNYAVSPLSFDTSEKATFESKILVVKREALYYRSRRRSSAFRINFYMTFRSVTLLRDYKESSMGFSSCVFESGTFPPEFPVTRFFQRV